jgi:hypothetical protein
MREIEIERIKKDIELFEKNVENVGSIDEGAVGAIELAKQYYEDAKYYLCKKDYFTAFGCINYAHGLLDAIRNLKEAKVI